ncbi:hypothetical protein FACS18948_5610 [Clostridia bacterium]|nr:hypothetical protein FACS18948_5610 [Clostridia bacterium]
MYNAVDWSPPALPAEIPHGDMPGDKVFITDEHVSKSGTIFQRLRKLSNFADKVVISVYGGSGVGKSEIASILAYYFRCAGIGAYVMSGDNYPYRIPKYNDAERLSIFRDHGLRGLVEAELYTLERFELLSQWMGADDDANPIHAEKNPWFTEYLRAGGAALTNYLGTDKEIDFDQVSGIIRSFKEKREGIYLKRMGREETELWYEYVDFSAINVLILEWTHGGSEFLRGVDIPVYLHSTPEETLAHRKSRSRDGKTDSPFTTLVLRIEQEKLQKQSRNAAIILSKSGVIE